MDIVTTVIVGATLINAAKNLWELVLMTQDDPARERKYKIRTTKYRSNSRIKHYLLTIEGNRPIDIEPLD